MAVGTKALDTSANSGGDAVSLELEMIRRGSGGDRRAQAWLARRLVPRVRKVARALTSSAADADDAAQLSLLEILRSAHTFRGDASLDYWAGRIAARTTLRYLARERTKADPVVEHSEPLPAASTPSGLSDELPRDVREYLAALPEAQRDAIVLHHALGYSLDEIADMTQVSRNTVKGRLRLGTASLKKLVRREQRIGAKGRVSR